MFKGELDKVLKWLPLQQLVEFYHFHSFLYIMYPKNVCTLLQGHHVQGCGAVEGVVGVYFQGFADHGFSGEAGEYGPADTAKGVQRS